MTTEDGRPLDLERAKLPELLAHAEQGEREAIRVGLELLRRKRLRVVKREIKVHKTRTAGRPSSAALRKEARSDPFPAA